MEVSESEDVDQRGKAEARLTREVGRIVGQESTRKLRLLA